MTSRDTPDPLADLLGGGPDLADLMGPGADLLADDLDPAELMAGDPEPTPDPLADVPVTDSLEVDAAAELSALEQGYRARARAEADRFRDATDSEYWVAIVFKNRAEKESFLDELGLLELGDKYLIGRDVARRVTRKGRG